MAVGTRPEFNYPLAARVVPPTFAPLWMAVFPQLSRPATRPPRSLKGHLRLYVAWSATGCRAPFPAIRGIATEPLRFNPSRARTRNIHRRFGGRARCGHSGDILQCDNLYGTLFLF